MAYNETVLRRARQRLQQARADREQENAAHLEQAYARYPRLREIDRQLRTTLAQIVAASVRSGEDPTAALEAVREENLALQREREWIVEAGDFEEGYLDDTPICPKCGGTGYVGAQMCDCLRELCRQEQKKELTTLFGNGRESFETFRLSCYSDQYDPQIGASPRRMMQGVFAICRRYAQEFSLRAGNLLFTGDTGLGKTFLSACIARVVADSGFSVVYDTAGKLFSDFETAKFGESTEENRAITRKYLQCDLLIIDDLGTEMTTQFVVSALYTVVNTRLMDGMPTIISTNLTPETIGKRYSAQIASRLLGTYKVLSFYGEDIRLQKKA